MKSYIKQYYGFCQHQAFRPLFCPLSQTYFYWPWITISHFPFAFAIPYVSSGTQYAENQVVKDLAVNLRHFINSTFKSLVTVRTGGSAGGLFRYQGPSFLEIGSHPFLSKSRPAKGVSMGHLYNKSKRRSHRKQTPSNSTNSDIPSKACYMPGTVLSELYTLAHLILTIL